MVLGAVLCDRCKKPMRIIKKSTSGSGLGANTSLPTPMKSEPLSASVKPSDRAVVYYCESCFATKIIED